MINAAAIADLQNLDDLVSGRTNSFIALREGWTSEETIARVKLGIKKNLGWLSPVGAVIHINQAGVAEYAGIDREANRTYLSFDIYGNITRKARGRPYDGLSFFGLHHVLPWVKAAMMRNDEIITLAASLVSQNKADLAGRIEGIEVYLEGPEGLSLIHGKQVTPVEMEGAEKFLTAPNVTILKLLAHYLGANALVSYAQASPARATPVIITPNT